MANTKDLYEQLHELREEMRLLKEKQSVSIEVFIKNVEIFIKNETTNNLEGFTVVNDASTHISGSVGALAQTGATQIIGNINQGIDSLKSNANSKLGAEALYKLSQAISGSDELPSERERRRFLEDIEELISQASKPKDQREKGSFSPIIDRLANFCSGAGGLASVWVATSPAILQLFS